MLASTPHPEEEAALRRANMYYYANPAAAQREQVIKRARQATRAREKEQYAAQRARAKAFCEASLY